MVHPFDGRRGAVAHFAELVLLKRTKALAMSFDAAAVLDGGNFNPTNRTVILHLKISERGKAGSSWWWFDFFADDLEDVCTWIPWSH